MSKFIFTCGDINGIGPEIVLKTLNRISVNSRDKFIFICPQNVFKSTANIIKPKFSFEITNNIWTKGSNVTVLDIGPYRQDLGKVSPESGKAAFLSINLSFELTDKNFADAIITAPISKSAVQMAGYNFPGHTEMYAKWCGTTDYIMMFLSKEMNAALATIHEPIRRVSQLLSVQQLSKKFEVIFNSLERDLKIKNPRIAVLGLNPHAGENGLIGIEEKEIIAPAIKKSKLSKYLSGPFSPDAFFGNRLYKKYDLVLGMYHDQVLIPFKLINFGSGVNYTAGLPIVRTSPDHGTAFDIAGKGTANESSLISAFLYARKIVRNRKKK